MSVSAVVATIHLRIHQGGTLMSQSQEYSNADLHDMIYGLNETMVGKLDAINERFDAVGKRIDKLESTLTDDALALSSEHEALIAGLSQRLERDGGNLAEWYFSSPNNWVLMNLFSIVFSMATQDGLDPSTLSDQTIEYFRERFEDE